MRPIFINGPSLCIPAQTNALAPLKIQRVGRNQDPALTLANPTLLNGQLCYVISPEVAALKAGRYDAVLQGVSCVTCVPLVMPCK